MSSSSATGASSRSSSPATPPASHDLQLVSVGVQEDAYQWLGSSPVTQHTSWDEDTSPRMNVPKAVAPLSIHDILHDSAFEDPSSPSDSVAAENSADPGAAHILLSSLSQLFPASQPAPPSQGLRWVDPSNSPATAAAPVVFPSRDICQNLPIVFPNIPEQGAKSRVETQIRVALDLSTLGSHLEGGQDARVGSWKWVKLPKGTSTKKRSRKAAKISPTSFDTLRLSLTVACASPPHTPVLSCQTCQTREAKRLARKIAARVRPPRSDSDDAMVEDDVTLAGNSEDTSNIVQFNCPDILDFSTGSTILPLRITCYCRHHREKVGFRVTFTLHDEGGRVVGAGTTPPIMITDDHKTATGTRKKVSEAGVTGREGSASGRVRAKPYEHGRPDSRKTSTTGSPASMVPSLPMTRSVSPVTLDPSMWLPHPGGIIPADWNVLPVPASSVPPSLGTATPVDLQITPTASAAHNAISLASPIPLSSSLTFFSPPTASSLISAAAPVIHRLVPSKGPTSGGTEVTVLGSNFPPSVDIKCVFGDVVATSTQRWSDNTLVCIVPPRLTPGVVPVWIEGTPMQAGLTPPHFTYEDESDRALMELALQVVGLKLTGKVEDAKNVALRIVGNPAVGDQTNGTDVGNMMQVMASEAPQFEASIIRVLSLLDVSVGQSVSRPVVDVISRQTSGGQTMLHLAVLLKLTGVVDFLLAHGIDVDSRDRNGYTALHFAAATRGAVCARKLIRAGADVEVVNARGQAPRDLAPAHFFRGMAAAFGAVPPAGFSSDEDAELGDVEDDSDAAPRVRTLRRRIVRKRASTMLAERFEPPQTKPTPDAADNKLATADGKQPAPSDGKHKGAADEKGAAASYAELIQRTLSQLSRERLAASMPQLLVPLLPDLPGMMHAPWATLPQIPLVFPIVVPAPAWPAFLDKRSYSSDSGSEQPVAPPGALPRTSVASAVKTAQEWLAFWEKLRAQAMPALVPGAQEHEDSPPPVYTPRAASPSDATDRAGSRRTTYPEDRVSEQVVNDFRPARKQVVKPTQKKDRMLFFFWLPMLFAGFMWAVLTAVGLALRTMVEMKTGIRL